MTREDKPRRYNVRLGKKKNLLDFAGCWKGYPENPDEFMKELRKLWSTRRGKLHGRA